MEEKRGPRKGKFASLVLKESLACRAKSRRSIVLGSSANVRPDNFRCGGWIYRGIELPRNFQSLGNYTSSRLPVAFSRSALCKGWHRYDDTAAIPLRLTSEHLLRKIPWNSEAAAKKTTQKFS